ncbi:toxin glutamine deamidase domain-containing protein [Streptomyces platensis]|uniref:toxin glutamine deamidase domain-containing protein n=1 Tax=Streptomyces platensis TaxID=58346 RepID=UPI002E8211A8|nr:toxin glutamine deamidase domain-containing protein [Streptomyces platensis]WUB79182.1 toxin glutamine deamidase domain-containing protein [Streptomyces platensis]
MALMLPNALEWVLEMCGFEWPTGDEDKMMECANTWRQFAADVESLQARGVSAAGNVLAESAGDSIDGFNKTWEKFGGGSGYFDDARQGAELIAICMDAAAMLIIGLKVAVIAQLIILAIEIIAAQAAAPFTLGLSELGAMGAAAATRLILRKLLKEIAQQILQAVLETAKEPFVSALEAMVSDVVAQTVEQNFGKQSGYDLGRTAKKGYEEGKDALKNSGSTFGESLRDGAGSRAGHGARHGLTNSGHDGDGGSGDGSSDSGNDSSSNSNDSSSNNTSSSSDSSSSDSSPSSANSSNSSSSANSSSDGSSSSSNSPSSSSSSPSSSSGDSGRRAPDIGGPSSSSPSSGSDSSSPSPSSSSDGPSASSSPSSSASTPSHSSTDSTGSPDSSNPSSSSSSPSRGSDAPSPFDVGTQVYNDSIGRPLGDDSSTPDSSPDSSTPSTPPSTTTSPDVEGGLAPDTTPDSARPDSTPDAPPSTAPGNEPSVPANSSPIEGPGTTPDVDGSSAPDTTPDSARPSRPEGVDVHTPEQGASIPDPRNTEPAPMPSPPPETDRPEAAPTPAPDNSRPEPGVHQVDRDAVTPMPAPAQGPVPGDSHDGNNNDSQNQGSGRVSMPSGAMPGNTPTAHPSPGQGHAPTPSTPSPHDPDDENVGLMSTTATAAPPTPGTQPDEAGIPQQAAPSSATPSTPTPGAMPPPAAGPIPTQAPAAGNPTTTRRATTPSATTPRTEQPGTRPTTPSRDTQQNRPVSPPRTETPRSETPSRPATQPRTDTPRTETPSRPTTPPRTDTPRAETPRTETPGHPATPPRGEQPTNRPTDRQSPAESPTSTPNDQGMPAPDNQQPDNQQPHNQQPDATHQTPDQNQPPADDSTPEHPTAPSPPPQADNLSDIRDGLNIPFEGLTTPDPAHQQDLENAHPRNPDGTPQVYADPRQGNWAGLQNDGGVGVPGRSNNCADCTRSFLETWFGRPTVSAPRTLDLNADGSLNTYSAERDSVDNQTRWAGAPSTYAGKDHPNPYARIAYELSQAGHGSAAVIGVNWPGGGGHAFAAVNHNGQVLFVDAQTGVVSENPIHLGAQEVFYTPLDANRNPITPYFLAPSTPQPSTQDTPDTNNSSDPDSSTDQSTPDAQSDGPAHTSPSAEPSTDEAPSDNDDSTAEQNANDAGTDTAPPSTTPESSTTPETTPAPEATSPPETTSPQNEDTSADTHTTPDQAPDATDQDSPQPDDVQDTQDTQDSQESQAPQDSQDSQDTQDTQNPQDTDQQTESREPVFPSTATRPSGPPDGYDDPTDADNRAQQEGFPRNEDGSFQQAPDPREGTWVDDLRGQNPDESGRDVNCPDGSLAFVDSYAGNPTVAARRSPNEDGTAADTPEPNGRDRIENALGAEFDDFGDGRDAYNNLETTLLNEGHGSQAVIITQNADGRAHAWNVVNHNGQIVYADPQTGQRGTTPLHNGDSGVFAIPLDANRRPVDATIQPTAHPQSPTTPAATDRPSLQRPAGATDPSDSQRSAEATREQRNQSLPNPEAPDQQHANLPPDQSQQDLRREHEVRRIDLTPVQQQMRAWAEPQSNPPTSPLGNLLQESVDRRQQHAESAQHIRDAKQALDDAKKETDSAKRALKKADPTERAAAEQRLNDAKNALAEAKKEHRETLRAHRDNVSMPATNFTDSDLRRHLDPAWSQMNDGDRYAALATLGRMSHSFHANNAVGASPEPAPNNDPYADAPPKKRQKIDPAHDHHESVASTRREASARPKDNAPQDLRDLLDETERNSPDFSDKNYAVVEVVDERGESHYIIDSSVPAASDAVRPRHSEGHILEWVDQLNNSRDAEGRPKYKIAGLYTEREPCGLRKDMSGHADCSKTIRDSDAMDGVPVYYSTTYRVDPQRKELLEQERAARRDQGKTDAEIKKALDGYKTPNRQLMDREIQQHLDFVDNLLSTMNDQGQTPPTTTDPNRTPPADPAGVDRRPPANPAGTDRRPPADSAGTPTTNPTDSERTPSADLASVNSPVDYGTADTGTADNGTSAPADSPRSHRDVPQTETEGAGAGNTPRPTTATTGSGEQAGAPNPSADEPREGSPASDNQPEKRGRIKQIWQSMTRSGPAEPTEITTEVDQPRFGNHKKLAEFQPDVYGTPLDRPDGTRVPLFDGPPSREQTKQGAIGDCGIIATLGAIASRYPDLLQDMIRETEDGNYEVRFHEVRRNNYGNQAPTGRILTVRVTPDVPVYSDFPSITAYANANDVGVAWPAIMEKAIAGLDQFWDDKKREHESQLPRNRDFDDNLLTGYSRIGQGSTSGDRAELLAQLTGRTSENHDFPTNYDMNGRSPEKQLLAHLRELTESGRPVVIGTQPRGKGVENKMEKGLLSSHAYEIVSVDDKGLIHLRNPHNEDDPQPLTIKEFMKYCSNQYASLEDEK